MPRHEGGEKETTYKGKMGSLIFVDSSQSQRYTVKKGGQTHDYRPLCFPVRESAAIRSQTFPGVLGRSVRSTSSLVLRVTQERGIGISWTGVRGGVPIFETDSGGEKETLTDLSGALIKYVAALIKSGSLCKEKLCEGFTLSKHSFVRLYQTASGGRRGGAFFHGKEEVLSSN